MQEVWKQIEKWEQYYLISNYGNIKRLKRKNCNNQHKNDFIMSPFKDKDGYLKITLKVTTNIGWLKQEKYFIHRLVGKYFVSNPNNYKIINHIDSNRQNNYYTNIEWVTQKQNIQHSIKQNKHSSIKNSKKCIQINVITNKVIAEFKSMAEAERNTKISATSISAVCRNKRKTAGGCKWKYI